MYIKQWDNLTLVLYFLIAFIVVTLIKNAEKRVYFVTEDSKKNIKKKYSLESKLMYIIGFILLVWFASTRVVAPGIGGTDASWYYVEHFLSARYTTLNLGSLKLLQGEIEPLYRVLEYSISKMTTSYHLFFVVIYGIISFGILKFASSNLGGKRYYFVYFLFIIQYLYSFSAIRSSIALSFFLIAIIYLKEGKKYKFFAFSTIAFLFHYTALVSFGFYLFYSILKKIDRNKRHLIFFTIVSLVIIFVSIPIIEYALSFTKYRNWTNEDPSIWGHLPIIILVGMILIFRKELVKRYPENNIHLYLVIFNLAVLPIAMYLNAYRLSNYFFFSRLIVWSQIIPILKAKLSSNDKYMKLIINVLASTLVILWFLFRITKMWDKNSLMPYINILFN